MRIVTTKEMEKIDKSAFEDYGINSMLLMENAGRGVCDVLEEYLPNAECGMRNAELEVWVFSGKGNNGGDGFVVSRHLSNRGFKVRTFLLGKAEDLKGDALTNLKILKKAKIEIVEIPNEGTFDRVLPTYQPDFLIDAIFGTGFSGEPKGLYKKAISYINSLENSFIISIDIPSGVSADNGTVAGEAVIADTTVTMGFLKPGLLLFPGRSFAGDVWISDIGIPERDFEEEGNTYLITDKTVLQKLPKRPEYGHKGTFGSVLILAGSRGFTGAATLTSLGALRIGAGLVRLCVPRGLANPIEAKLTEVVKVVLPHTDEETFALDGLKKIIEVARSSDVLVIGPGISTNPETKELQLKIIKETDLPLVIDADGVTNLKGSLSVIKKKKSPVVLTPHPGELSRLIGLSPEEINKSRIEICRKYAQEFKAILVLKGAPTVIGSLDGKVYLNPTGNNGMGSGGTGDVLTGMIGGLIAQGASPLDAALCSVYLHGLAGDLAQEEKTEYSLIAGDLLDFLPKALKEILED